VVNPGVKAYITLNNVNISIGTGGACTFDMTGATVNLTLEGSNILKSGVEKDSGKAGLHAPFGSILEITAASSSASLQASGDIRSAGIGGGYTPTPAATAAISPSPAARSRSSAASAAARASAAAVPAAPSKSLAVA
jgi:hypothetical protein